MIGQSKLRRERKDEERGLVSSVVYNHNTLVCTKSRGTFVSMLFTSCRFMFPLPPCKIVSSSSAMDHEYKVHHITSQLLTLLQLQHLQGSEAHTDTPTTHDPYQSTQVSIHTALRKIGECSSKKEEFLQKYDELKVQQARELDPLVYLLSKMVDDKPLCDFIQERRPAQVPKSRVQATSLHQVDVLEGVPIPELPPKRTKLTPSQVQALKGTC